MGRLRCWLWWFAEVKFRRGPGERIVFTRIVGLILCLLLLVAWAKWGGPLDTALTVTQMQLAGDTTSVYAAMASSLSQAAGALAGFTMMIVVLLMTLAEPRNYIARISDARYKGQRLNAEQRRLLTDAVLFVRDMASAMLTIAFFGFVVAILGFSITLGRAETPSTGVVYLIASCSFYVALLLFFGSLVPLFRLMGFVEPVPYARTLFLGATAIGAIWLTATARVIMGTTYILSIRVVVFVAAGIILPLWSLSSFGTVTTRRRGYPRVGLWLAVLLIAALATIQLLVPKALEPSSGPVWPAVSYLSVAASISLAVGWAMLFGSLDPHRQPVFYDSATVIAVSTRRAGRDCFGISICGFTEDDPACVGSPCSGLLLAQATDQTLRSVGLGAYLAVYRALFMAADHTGGDVICVVRTARLANHLNNALSEGISRRTTLRKQLVLRSIAGASRRFRRVTFISRDHQCARILETMRLTHSRGMADSAA